MFVCTAFYLARVTEASHIFFAGYPGFMVNKFTSGSASHAQRNEKMEHFQIDLEHNNHATSPIIVANLCLVSQLPLDVD